MASFLKTLIKLDTLEPLSLVPHGRMFAEKELSVGDVPRITNITMIWNISAASARISGWFTQ
jgi:hypothetical protein